MAVITHNTTALAKVKFAQPSNQAGPSRPRQPSDSSSALSPQSSRQASPIVETQFQSQGEDSDDQLWEADCILDERGEIAKGEYLVKWVGNDPATGENWEPTWERRDGVTPALAKEWKDKKKREPNCVGIEGKKLEAAQKAKMEAARRKKHEARLAKSRKKGKGKSTPRNSEVIDFTKSRSRTLDTPDTTAKKTKRSNKAGPTERDTPVKSGKKAKPEPPNSTSSSRGVPVVVLPRKSRSSLATVETAAEAEADIEPVDNSAPAYVQDQDGSELSDSQPEPTTADQEEDIATNHPAEPSSPPQTNKRAAPASSPLTDQSPGPKQKRVRIDPVVSSMKPSEAGQCKPKSAQKAKAKSGTEAVESDPASSSQSLGPVPVPSASQFRALIAGNDSSQSTISTGPGLSQLDPIQQFSSPARDSLNPSKTTTAEKSTLSSKVQKKIVNGEEVLGVESDSEEEAGQSGPEMSPPVIDTEKVSEEVATIDAVEPVPQVETIVDKVTTTTTTALAVVEEPDVPLKPAAGSSRSPATDDREVPSTTTSPVTAPASSTSNGKAKTPTAMDRLDAAAARKSTAGSSRIPLPARKTPRPVAPVLRQPGSTAAEASGTSEDWSLRLSPAVRQSNDQQRTEILVLRRMIASLQVEKAGGWKGKSPASLVASSTSTEGDGNGTSAASAQLVKQLAIELSTAFAATTKKVNDSGVDGPTTASIALQTEAPPAVPASTTTDTMMQTDPIPVVPAVTTADMALQTDAIPVVPPIVTIDMALQTDIIPPIAVTDMASQTIPITVPTPIAVTTMASQMDPLPDPPTLDQTAFDEQLAAKDADRKKWRSRAKRAEAELVTIQEDLQFIRERYNEASESAVNAVARSNELEAKVTILQDQLKFGLKQRELHNSAIKGQHDKQVSILVAQNKILLEQSRRTDDSVRAKAAAHPGLEALHERLEQLLQNAMRKIEGLSDRNDELVSQIEILRATQMGVLHANVADDSEDEDYSYESGSELSAAPSPSPPPVRPSNPRNRNSGAAGRVKTESPVRASLPSPTASQLMPDTQDLISAGTSNSLDSSAGSDSLSRPQERNGEAYPNPCDKGVFYANESAVKEHLMHEVDHGFM